MQLPDFPDADAVLIESVGDNVAATFSHERSGLTIYIIDVAAGFTTSDLFVPTKTDLAPFVGTNLDVMDADTRRMRTTAQGLKPCVMTNLKTLAGADEVLRFIETGGLVKR